MKFIFKIEPISDSWRRHLIWSRDMAFSDSSSKSWSEDWSWYWSECFFNQNGESYIFS